MNWSCRTRTHWTAKFYKRGFKLLRPLNAKRQAVIPIAVISAWLGYADPAFTMRTYVHAQDGALNVAADTLQKVVTTS